MVSRNKGLLVVFGLREVQVFSKVVAGSAELAGRGGGVVSLRVQR